MNDKVIRAVKAMKRKAITRRELDLIEDIIAAINEFQEVTCQECRYNQTFKDWRGKTFTRCALLGIDTTPEAYCSYAEK